MSNGLIWGEMFFEKVVNFKFSSDFEKKLGFWQNTKAGLSKLHYTCSERLFEESFFWLFFWCIHSYFWILSIKTFLTISKKFSLGLSKLHPTCLKELSDRKHFFWKNVFFQFFELRKKSSDFGKTSQAGLSKCIQRVQRNHFEEIRLWKEVHYYKVFRPFS